MPEDPTAIPTIDTAQLVAAMAAICHDLEAAKDYLTELDAAVGDGDLGISVARGCRAVREGLHDPPDDVGQVLVGAGMRVADAAGATIGALLSLGLTKSGRAMARKTAVTLPDLAVMLHTAEDAIKRRGRADVGDKTLLDALVPARQALEEAIADGLPTGQAAKRVLAAAEAGMTATTGMRSRAGRARWLSERTAGYQDPGATVIYLMVRSVVGG